LIIVYLDISHRLYHINTVVKEFGLNVFIVSYRGYGKSSGVPDESGMQIDAQTALNYLLNDCVGINTKKIFCFGRSLGGAIAIDLALRNQSSLCGLMVENTFASIPSMIDSLFKILSFYRYLSKNNWNSIDKIKHFNKDFPILFLSGLEDELVPHKQMLELYELSSSEHKTIKIYKDGRHNTTFLSDGYNEDVIAWLKLEGIISSHLSKEEQSLGFSFT